MHRPWGQHYTAYTGPGVSLEPHENKEEGSKLVPHASWRPHSTPLIYAGLTFPSELSPGLIEPFCFMLDSFIILKFCEAEVSNVSTLITVIASLR